MKSADMGVVLMFEDALSDPEREKFRKAKSEQVELLKLAEMRLQVRTESLKKANERLRAARKRSDDARQAYEEALIMLTPDDDDDDYATRLEKAEKFDKIETEYIEAGEDFKCSMLRSGWELREINRLGLDKE